MPIPDSFDASERGLIRKAFFGHNEPIQAIIFTPIRIFYSSIGVGLTSHSGWWENRYGDHTMVALTPQGSATIDVIAALEPNTQITFLGIAGSTKNLPIGCIVEPEVAFIGRKSFSRSFIGPVAFQTVRIATVSSLAESRQNLNYLARNVDCVDMETAYIYSASLKQNKPARSIQVISDTGSTHPFFSTNLAMIEAPVRRVARFVEQYLGEIRS